MIRIDPKMQRILTANELEAIPFRSKGIVINFPNMKSKYMRSRAKNDRSIVK